MVAMVTLLVPQLWSQYKLSIPGPDGDQGLYQHWVWY